MHAPRRLVLIDKITGIEVWEREIFTPLTDLSFQQLYHIFCVLLETVERADLVSGRMYFAWR